MPVQCCKVSYAQFLQPPSQSSSKVSSPEYTLHPGGQSLLWSPEDAVVGEHSPPAFSKACRYASFGAKAPAKVRWSKPAGAVPDVAYWYSAARKMPLTAGPTADQTRK